MGYRDSQHTLSALFLAAAAAAAVAAAQPPPRYRYPPKPPHPVAPATAALRPVGICDVGYGRPAQHHYRTKSWRLLSVSNRLCARDAVVGRRRLTLHSTTLFVIYAPAHLRRSRNAALPHHALHSCAPHPTLFAPLVDTSTESATGRIRLPCPTCHSRRTARRPTSSLHAAPRPASRTPRHHG